MALLTFRGTYFDFYSRLFSLFTNYPQSSKKYIIAKFISYFIYCCKIVFDTDNVYVLHAFKH